ncbi:hypothetical protein QBE52_16750 [Clostridiaceae bacterium 35-E11]
MPVSEETKRDVLLVIVSMLFIIFVTGIGEPVDISAEPIVIS